MKKLGLASLILGSIACSPLIAAETGTLNFTGSVQSGSCSIDGGADLTATFTTVLASTLNFTGEYDPGNSKPVSIKLKDCQDGTVASLAVRGTRIDGWAAAFGQTSEDEIAVKIFNDDASFTFNPENSKDYTMVSGNNEIKLNASLVAVKRVTPSAQDFSIPLTYSLTYN